MIRLSTSPAVTAASSRLARVLRKISLRLIVPIGLLHRAARAAHGGKGPPGHVAAEFARCRMLVFVGLPGPQVGEPSISGILEDERLTAVADHDPFAASH